MRKSDRIALVTGGARGIGLEIVRQLAHDAAGVAVFDVKFDDPAWGEAGFFSTPVERFVVNVADEESVQRGVQAARDRFGSIDIVVNNAGISPTHNGLGLPVDEISIAEWTQVLGINLTGAFLITKHTIPAMKEKRWGRIINVSSQTARLVSSAVSAHYAASKAGILALTRTTALELGPFGATANSVAPGLTETAMMRNYSFESYAQTVPLRRLGQPSDIAGAIAFLASDAASYITGATLDVNGGRFMPL